MNQVIDYSPSGYINLNLLKSEIDRRVTLILSMLEQNSKIDDQLKKGTGLNDQFNMNKVKQTIQENIFCFDVTPVKEPQLDNSIQKRSSIDSDSKQKIQKSQNQCFNNLTPISDELANQFSISFNNDEKNRNKLRKSITEHHSKPKNKENQREHQISNNSKSVKKVLSKKTPPPSQFYNSKTTSAAKRQSLNISSLEERKMRNQVKNQLSLNNIKKEVINNNARSNLLKRIEGMSVKTKDFNTQLI